MKKILSILVMLVLMGGILFAQGLEVTPSGSATLSWGIDLNDNIAHGFYNEHDFMLKIPFFGKTEFKGGSVDKDADVYADVSFKILPGKVNEDSEILDEVNKSAIKEASATLYFYGGYITVYDKPSFAANKATGWNSIVGVRASARSWFNPSFKGWGTKIGYKNKDLLDLDLGLKFGSNGNWEEDNGDVKPGLKKVYGKAVGGGSHQFEYKVKVGETLYAPHDLVNPELDNSKGTSDRTHLSNYATALLLVNLKPVSNKYGIGFDFTVSPLEDYLTINGTVNAIFDKTYESSKGMNGNHVNFGIAVTSKPIDKLKIVLGFDAVAVSKFIWDAALTVSYNWVDTAIYFAGKDSDHANGKTVNMAAHLGFTSKESGDTNFVPGLAFGAVANAYYLLSDVGSGKTVPLGLKVNLSYKASITDSMWIKPYAVAWGETNNTNGTSGKPAFAAAYETGIVYSPIEKVEVKAAWKHGSLNKRVYEGGFKGGFMIKNPVGKDKGTFILSLKLIY